MVCIGEGEEAICELLDRLERGESHSAVKNIYLKMNGNIIKNGVRALNQNLDALPFPDYDMD